MKNSEVKTVEEILGKTFNIDPKQVSDESSPQNIKEWDSFNALLLVTELEKNFKVEFSVEDVVSIKNVGDIKKILKKYEKS